VFHLFIQHQRSDHSKMPFVGGST